MDIWQTASPDHPVPSGWLGRWLDAHGRDPLLAVSLEPVLPPMLAGETVAGAAKPVTGLALPGGPLGAAFAGLGTPARGDSDPASAAARAVTDLHRTAVTLGAAGPATTGTTETTETTGTTGTTAGAREAGGRGSARVTKPLAAAGGGRGEGQLVAQLDAVARCVEMGVPTRVYSVSLGGFDTHAGERATQRRLLSEVDEAVTAFLTRMADGAHGRGVVLVAYSEFGRRVAANANQGTDHGTAGPVLVAGASVRGGFVGEQPSLTDLDDGDLKATGDFRDVYATLLADVLNADPERVLGPGRRLLPLIAT